MISKITYNKIMYYHIVYDFYIFLLNYIENFNLANSDKVLLAEIKSSINNTLHEDNLNNIYNTLPTLIGAIKNYKKINKWDIKRKINISDDFDYCNMKDSIDNILSRLENGIGFLNTNFLSEYTPNLFFQDRNGAIRPNDDNLFFTFGIFHFHLPDIKTNKRTKHLFYAQLTDTSVNCLLIGEHKNDLYDYQKWYDILNKMKTILGNDIQMPLNYDDLINRESFGSYRITPHVAFAAQHLQNTSGNVFNAVIDSRLKIEPKDIKTARCKFGANIFTKDFYTTYTTNGINTYAIASSNGILKGLYQLVAGCPNLNLSCDILNNVFNDSLNSYLSHVPVKNMKSIKYSK